jgi:hypothetical protein
MTLEGGIDEAEVAEELNSDDEEALSVTEETEAELDLEVDAEELE